MKIVFLEPIGISPETIRERFADITASGHELMVYPERTEDEDTLIRRASDADIVVVSNIPLRKRFFESSASLKMISVAFTGFDHIDIRSCTERGITVCNAAGYSTEAVAELAFGMMISLVRDFSRGERLVRNGKARGGLIGTELKGKVVGIAGLGRIGSRVGEIASAFGCKVIGYNRSPKNILPQVSKEELLSQSDIISLHLPLNEDTAGFIDEKAVSLMKDGVVLINTARGGLLSSEALAKGLESGKIRAAATDVYESEPPLAPSHPLLKAPNLLMLPHMGYATEESFRARLELMRDNIKAFLDGHPVNKVC